MDGVVPALVGADGVDAADVAGLRLERVVPALAVGAADRVDRREVEHVEAEVLHVRQAADDVVEGAVPVRVARLRAREQLVPGGEARREPVGDHLERAVVARDSSRARRCGRRAPRSSRREGAASCAAEPSSGCLEPAQQRRQRLSVGAGGALRRRLGDAHALDGLETQRLRRRLLLADLVEPGAERVAPGLDRELVAGVALERKAAGPAVVVDEAHRRAAPLGLAGNAVEHRGGDLLVAVGEDVGPDLDGIADDALDRRAAAVDLRPHRLDDDAALAVGLALARRLAHRRQHAAPLAQRRCARHEARASRPDRASRRAALRRACDRVKVPR